jgi:hypothetical protein
MRIAYGFAGMRPLREEAGMSVYAASSESAPVPAWFAIDDEAAW